MRVIGHRGASRHAPENTLRAFTLALSARADGIETDVRLTADGRLVLMHDDDLSRRAGIAGSVSTATFDELRALDVGEGERIPTLEEALALPARWYLELKPHGPGEVLASAVAPHLAERGVVVSSFDHGCVELLRALAPGARTALTAWRGAPLDALTDRCAESGHAELHAPLGDVHDRDVERARESGIELLVYTVNDPTDVRAMRALGVGGIFTDDPAGARAALG